MSGSTQVYLAAAAVVVLPLTTYLLVAIVYGLYLRYRFRQLPSPPSNLLLGHIAAFATRDLYLVAHDWSKQYGKMFVVWLGQRPLVWISDLDLVVELGIKRFSSFYNRDPLSSFGIAGKPEAAVHKELVFAHQPLWSSLRGALQPMFHSSSLASYAPIINEKAMQLRSYLEKHAVPEGATAAQSIEVHRLASGMTLDVIGHVSMGCELDALSALLQGKPGDASPWMVAAVQDIFAGTALDPLITLSELVGPQGGFSQLVTQLMVKATNAQGPQRLYKGKSRLYAAARTLYRNALQRLAAKGEKVPEPDDSWVWWDPQLEKGNPCVNVVPAEGSLPDRLAKAKSKTGAAGMSELEAVANMYLVIGAGLETTATTLAFVLYHVARHKEVQAKLLQEIDEHGRDWVPGNDDVNNMPYLDAVVKETLRVCPVVTWVNRISAEDSKVNGRLVPKGAQIIFATYSILQDPTLFPEPTAFRPERWIEAADRLKPVANLAFGLGPRNCIGMRLAQEEVKIALVRLYQRLTFDVDMTHHAQGLQVKQNITVNPVNGVHLIPRRR